MKAEFWHERWQKNEIGFHQAEINAALLHNWSLLGVAEGSQVLVPLCGKSKDMLWLAQQGHRVLGVELSAIACEAFFRENNISFTRTDEMRFVCYRSASIELICGDLFALTATDLRAVSAVYDRASLVALPPDMRARYARFMIERVPNLQMLLVSFEYDQTKMPGPPHSVPEAEIRQLYEGQLHRGISVQVKELHNSGRQQPPPHIAQRGLEWISESVYRIGIATQ